MTEAAAATSNSDPLASGARPVPSKNQAKAPIEKEREIQPLRGNFQMRSHVVRDFAATVPAATLPEDILSGDFWVHVANQLSDFAEIRVLWEDGSKYAKLLVLHVAGRFSKFKCLYFVELDQVDTSLQAEDAIVKVENRGPKKWCLIDAVSGDVIKAMMSTQAEAFKERTDLIRARAR